MQDVYKSPTPPTPDNNFQDRNAALFHGALGTRNRLLTFLQRVNDPDAKVFPYHGVIPYDYERETPIYRSVPKDEDRYQFIGGGIYRDWSMGGHIIQGGYIPEEDMKRVPSGYNTSERIVGSPFFSGYFAYKDRGNNYSLIFLGYTQPYPNGDYLAGVVTEKPRQWRVGSDQIPPFLPDSKTPNPSSAAWQQISNFNTWSINSITIPADQIKDLAQNEVVIEKVRRQMEDVLSSIEAESKN